MPNELPDLWPEDFGGDENLITPSTILKQAAAQLGNRTQQLVTADATTSMKGNRFIHSFWIEVPSLSYRYKLFEVEHDVNGFYPLQTDEWVDYRKIELQSQDELQEFLKKMFASDKTKKLIDTLLKQVRS